MHRTFGLWGDHEVLSIVKLISDCTAFVFKAGALRHSDYCFNQILEIFIPSSCHCFSLCSHSSWGQLRLVGGGGKGEKCWMVKVPCFLPDTRLHAKPLRGVNWPLTPLIYWSGLDLHTAHSHISRGWEEMNLRGNTEGNSHSSTMRMHHMKQTM